jgi:protocatechuate 3,4-dioxygenase beta subunit
MDKDDAQVGRILTRREVLLLLGGSGVAVLSGCAAPSAPSSATQLLASPSAAAGVPSCVVRPALTEGPYFVDEKLNRSDIRSDPSDGSVRQGALLTVAFNVSSVSGGACAPLAGATLDLWHCDALGVYSDVQDPGFATSGKKFLRGYQATDAAGKAQFTTIYPGWYQGRAVHVHFKIRTASAGASSEFTSQLFFDDALSDRVHALAPYAQKGQRTLRNAADSIYRNGGDELLLQVTESGGSYAATFDIGLNL